MKNDIKKRQSLCQYRCLIIDFHGVNSNNIVNVSYRKYIMYARYNIEFCKNKRPIYLMNIHLKYTFITRSLICCIDTKSNIRINNILISFCQIVYQKVHCVRITQKNLVKHCSKFITLKLIMLVSIFIIQNICIFGRNE